MSLVQVINFVGLLGAMCFALSGLPQALKSIKDKHANGVATLTIWLWLIGEVSMLIYSTFHYSHDWVLLLNYTCNTLLVGIIAFYKHFGKYAKH